MRDNEEIEFNKSDIIELGVPMLIFILIVVIITCVVAIIEAM